jgi:hypothetical protein
LKAWPRNNFSEFMNFFSKSLNPFKIQTSFKLDLFLEFYNSKSRGIWKLGHKGILFHLNLTNTMKSLVIFWVEEDGVLYFWGWIIWSQLENLNFCTPGYCGPVGLVRFFYNLLELNWTSLPMILSSSWLVLKICKYMKISEVGTYLFQGFKQR